MKRNWEVIECVQMCLGYVQNIMPYCRRALWVLRKDCVLCFHLLKHMFAFVCYIMFNIRAEAKVVLSGKGTARQDLELCIWVPPRL